MMNYKSFYYHLYESYSKPWRAYWLDSHGKFYEVYLNGERTGNDGHFSFAKQYCIQHDISLNTPIGPVGEIINRGWSRITFNYYGDSTMNVDTLQKNFTVTVLRALKKKAEELNASKVRDSEGDRDLFIL